MNFFEVSLCLNLPACIYSLWSVIHFYRPYIDKAAKENYDPGIFLHSLRPDLSFCVPQIGCFQNIGSVDFFREKIRMCELPSEVKSVPYVTLRSFTHPHVLAHSKMSVTLDRG